MGSHAEKQAAMEAAATVQSQIKYQGSFISVRQDSIVMPDGSKRVRECVEHPGAVAIIPINHEGHLILVEQWRRAIKMITLEIPAGLMDSDESLEACAQRELQEEIGQKAGKLQYLGAFYSSPGVLSEKLHFFLAEKLSPSQLYAEDTHEIDIQVVPIEKALKLISEGAIVDAKTALGILLIGQKC